MRRVAIRVAIVWGAAAMASFALGCGSGESKPAAGRAAAPAAPTPTEPLGSPVAAVDMYVWDATKGAERDLAADSTECQAQITAQGLAGVAQHIQCMQQKGWTTRSPSS